MVVTDNEQKKFTQKFENTVLILCTAKPTQMESDYFSSRPSAWAPTANHHLHPFPEKVC